ncbi:hypothetical protein ACNKHV_17115 [Shigella flexneri]
MRIVSSPMDALKLAQEIQPAKWCSWAVVLKTTMPTTAITLQQAKARDVREFLLLLPAHYEYPDAAQFAGTAG